MEQNLAAYGVSFGNAGKVLLGAACTAVFTILRSRRSRLRWHASHQQIATSSSHPTIGNISVTFNDTPMTNIVVSTVRLENSYWRDFTNITALVIVAQGHQILRDDAKRQGNDRPLEWSERFGTVLQNALAQSGQTGHVDFGAFEQWREYKIPILNRGDTVTFTFLVHAVPPTPPFCTLTVEAPKATLVFEKRIPQQVFSVDILRAFVAGIVVSAPLAWIIILNAPMHWQPVLLVALGALITGIGAIAVVAYRWLRSRIF